MLWQRVLSTKDAPPLIIALSETIKWLHTAPLDLAHNSHVPQTLLHKSQDLTHLISSIELKLSCKLEECATPGRTCVESL